MKFVNKIPLKTHVCLNTIQPRFLRAGDEYPVRWVLCGPGYQVGLGISRSNADSEWNPVYKVFHRICCC